MRLVVFCNIKFQSPICGCSRTRALEDFWREGGIRLSGRRPSGNPFGLFPDPESDEIMVMLLELEQVLGIVKAAPLPISCRLSQVWEPVKNTAFPLPSVKYRGFAGFTKRGPTAWTCSTTTRALGGTIFFGSKVSL
jgi:hypothetical protein